MRHRLRVSDRRVLREDHRLERASLRRRLEAPLLVERAPRDLVGVERLLLAARAVAREHQKATQPLPIGVLRAERRRVGDHVVVVAELDLRLDPVLEGSQPELLEARNLVLQKALEGEVGERRPAPQRKRVAQCGRAL